MIRTSLTSLNNLVSVSRGEKCPDLLVRNGSVVNVFTGEIIEANVAISGNRIAHVGYSVPVNECDTRIIDAQGAFVVPGFIDAHCHPDLFSNPAAFSDWVITCGTTTILVDAQDMCNSFGMHGLKEVMLESEHYPLRMFFLAPAVTPPFPGVEGDEVFDVVELNELLKLKRVLGIAEITSYMRLVNGDVGLLMKTALARNAGKLVEGHTSGASFEKLNVLVAAGLTSCHESVSVDDVLQRLRLGLYTMVRCGSIRCELARIAPILGDPRLKGSNRLILTPDGLFADHITEYGYMDYVICNAIKLGVDPIQAIQMSTINPALYLGMDHDLGAIAPGYLADIVVVESIEEPKPVTVIQDGKIVFTGGEATFESSPVLKIKDEGKPFSMKEALPEMFNVKAPIDKRRGIPVIRVVDKTITRREDIFLPIRDGYVEADPERDVFKVAVFLRSGKMYNCGFVKGLGLGVDAISSSACHEIQEPLVVGRNDGAMVIALNRLLELKGGVVLVKSDRIIHELRLPIGGTMSSKSLPETAKDLISTKEVFMSLGCTLEEPLWTIGFLPFSALPDLRITVSGVYDVKKGRIVFDSKRQMF